ncbi:MAG: biotin--[acetyl-CoA-carboxylase] ligase [Bdellovibrionales bacterium GWA2_49_15]|nr:MAG: biotin--[acetyl-CoA-carboxylase] ligase [Bdellovibrionales bacterium GWA2_49_15]
MSPFETTLVSTQNQDQGLGRRGNAWLKCHNALAFSVLFPFHLSPTLASLKLGNDVCQFLKMKYEITVNLKWPNDIFLNGKKIGGIIAQLIQTSDRQQWILAGVGLNLGRPSPGEMEELAQYQAGFLSESIVLNNDDDHKIALELAELITQDSDATEASILAGWKNNCFHIGRQVIILENDQVICEGTFVSVGSEGQAIIKTIDRSQEVWSGTLRVRPIC